MLSLKKMLIVATMVMGGAMATGASQAEAGGLGCYGGCYNYHAPVRVYRSYRLNYFNHCAPTYIAPTYGYGFGY